MAREILVGVEEDMTTAEARMLRGGLLDMWQLYQRLSSDPDRLSDLTFFDVLSARDNMLFPDFFKAVHNFLHPSRFRVSRINGQAHPRGIDGLMRELDQTFRTMESKWESLGPFFERHPELRYLGELSFYGHQVREFGGKIPFLRGIQSQWLWSIVEYHRLRGNLDIYVALDTAISRNQGIGTLFEEDIGSYPGDFMIHLGPYGKAADRVQEYLPLLKHGDLIGFGTVALAQVDGQQFVVVSSLQTDLLRKDHVVEIGHQANFSHSKTKRNGDDSYTIPSAIRKPYLEHYDCAHRLVSVVEDAVQEISARFPVAGIIMPTLSSYGRSDFEALRLSKYASGLYQSLPGERGYHQREIYPVFPLTHWWERGAVFGSGEWWVKTIDELNGTHA